MNKKGEVEILLLLIGLALFIGFCFSSANPQTTFMNDCKSVYADDFSYETQCLNNSIESGLGNATPTYRRCTKVNKDYLKKYCLNKFANVGSDEE